MKKLAVVTASIILVSVIIIGICSLNKKSKEPSKAQENNAIKTLSAKEEDKQDKNKQDKDKQNEDKQNEDKQEIDNMFRNIALAVKRDIQPKTDPVAKPAVRKVIVIDPGHANKSNLKKEQQAPGSSIYKIKDGGGAEGSFTKTPEYRVNMLVSMKLKHNLEQMGYTVIMTKTDDAVSLGNIDRANIGNTSNAALVIRIHADSSDSSTANGASMLVPSPINENTKAIYSESKRCGQVVLNALTTQVGMPSRGVVERDDMTGFNWSKVPVILVEMGFLSNPNEDRLLSTSDYQTKLAKALADGIGVALK